VSGKKWANAMLCAAVALTGVVGSGGPASAIVGGTPSNFTDYPYFAMLALHDGAQLSCGASVIDPSWALTAAHCVPGSGSLVVTLPGVATATGQVIRHPRWNEEVSDGYDLALVRMPTNVFAQVQSVQVGAAWDPGAYAAGTVATVMGIGDEQPGGAQGRFLAADTILRSDDYMDDIFDSWRGPDYWQDQLMIGAGTTYQTVCYGDSGGPLVVSRAGHIVQVGVASFGVTTCDEAAVFAELSGPQLAWIATHVPSIIPRWGPCTASNGLPGTPRVTYSAFYGSRGAERWSISCEISIGVPPPPPNPTTVPNLDGDKVLDAIPRVEAADLVWGGYSGEVDAACNYNNQIMRQTPAAGTVVSRGTVVTAVVGVRPSTPCQ
jgi:hypothetical protein